jgi:CO/xanthine dehydrogenase FAD-binding subunit
VGACSAAAQRTPQLEGLLIGAPINGKLGERMNAHFLRSLTPIDDVRSDAQYPIDAAFTLVRRALNALGSGQ